MGHTDASFDAARVVVQGNELVVLGDLDGAIAAYSEAISLDPWSAAAYLGRGTARSRKGLTRQAIADANEAIRIDPGLSLGHNARGHGQLGQGRQRVFTFWRRGNSAARRAALSRPSPTSPRPCVSRRPHGTASSAAPRRIERWGTGRVRSGMWRRFHPQ